MRAPTTTPTVDVPARHAERDNSRVHRLVLDTNVLVSALLFRDSRHLPLAEGWLAGTLRPLLSVATWRELRAVAYRSEFGKADDEVHAALARLGPHLEWVEPDAARCASLPRCSDRADQKFLEVALCGGAEAILTYDRALLKLQRRGLAFEILTPEAWARSVG